MTKRLLALCAIGLALQAGAPLVAQSPGSFDERGYLGLGLALRRLNTAGVFMQATAHPDDENNGLLVMLNRGKGIRTTLATATRGDGGQNEIGPELFDALGVLRTEELLAVHRVDGAEQYFTRAVDFGYSFSIDETFQKWGRQEIIGDYVRLIRTVRPDVIVAMSPSGTGGGQHHQASALLSKDAFRAAGDPSQYPEQLKEGLRPWQAKKFYFTAGFPFPGAPPLPPGLRTVAVDTSTYDPLLGATYTELGVLARSMHKCQGMAQLLALPGSSFTFRYQLVDTTIPGQQENDETSIFDGVDSSVEGLTQYVSGQAPAALTSGLAAIASDARLALKSFESDGAESVVASIVSGLAKTREVRGHLADWGLDDAARFEIDTRLRLKEDQFQEAAMLATALRLEALADDGLVIPGQPLKVTVLAADRGAADVQVKQVAFEGFEGDAQACKSDTVKAGAVYKCEAPLQIPSGARPTAPYWRRLPDAARYVFENDAPFGLPFRPTPFLAKVTITVAGADVSATLPVQYRYEGNIFSGEKRMELKVVPRFAVQVTPEVAIIPWSPAGGTNGQRDQISREVRVTVTNGARGPSSGQVTMVLPDGWRVSPVSTPVTFEREDEAQTVRLTVFPRLGDPLGQYTITARVTDGESRFEQGYITVEYPHINRRHLFASAQTALKLISVRTPKDLTVGYVMGVGDQVPSAIQQLGARVEPIDADTLAWGDLGRFNAIVTGVRAYERRADLRAHNHRLIEYADHGGTVIVQYNKFEFNEAQYGPYPAKVSSGRITDEQAPVQILLPNHPVFQVPNKITDAAWKGWVQERGLYFLGDRDERYADLVQLEDPFENNRGPKRGALVEARVGRGRWIYLGLGLWRQLPAGTDGAYQLLANLISLGSGTSKTEPTTPLNR